MSTSEFQPDRFQPEIKILRSADAVLAEAPHLVPIYQTAFGGEPWYEVSECAAPDSFPNSCPGRRSNQAIGEMCAACGGILRAPAFSRQGLTEGWISHFREHEARFYLEQLEDGSCVLAALAWQATPASLADRCYSDAREREMGAWLDSHLPETFVWLEDIFAHRVLRPSGNLWNYRSMIAQFISELGGSVLAFRSINERLIQKTIQLFSSQAERLVALEDVPDHRDLILVRPAQ